MKTKIICTIGPASSDKKIIKELICSGMAVARINFSHGKQEEIVQRIKTIHEISKQLNKKIKILGDLQGPKIRIGYFKTSHINLIKGQDFCFTTEKIIGDSKIVSIDFENFHKCICPKDKIFLDDGKLELEVQNVQEKKIFCKVIVGGELSSRKGVNVLDKKLPLPGVTKQDITDLEFGAKIGMDWFAHSFVREAGHILEVKDLLSKFGARKTFVIAKIEDREGFENLDKIISVSDGIMVARGDLGVSVKRELVPLLQKHIIEKTNAAKKTDIVATQMLDTMINNPYPTRAEVNDVAVAVMQGADYVMLSAETAAGKYPVLAVQEMQRIICTIEKNKNRY